jgi:glutamate synthase domain-containing protein 2/nitrite reductase/ring-hydroxylating ferredoxin subunit
MSDWQAVCGVDELAEGRGREAWVNGRPIALFLYQGEVYALDDRCPHHEGQLSLGRMENGEAICPLHGWNFDLATGISPYNPNDRIATYPVRLSDGRVEVDAAAVPPLPPASFSGYQGRWRRWANDARGKKEIRRLAKGMAPEVGAMGAEPTAPGPLPDLSHFHLRAAQLARMPRLADEAVSTSVTIGRGARQPLRLALPAYVSHMSFGALSREAKMALARGAAMAGTLIGSGEGGMLPAERELAGGYVLEMASGYFGWNEQAMARADAFEIKIGQSAKPGLGGELPGKKVTAEIAEVRGLAPGAPACSPARFPDIHHLDELGVRIAWLRQHFPGKPVGIKFAANHLEEDVTAALSLQPDFITIDGFGGGTGAAPLHIRDHFGMPLAMALPPARELVDAHNAGSARPVSLLATGGIRTPADIMKAVALGADACALATAALFALGCEYYRACNTDNCPTGVTTQNPELRARIDVEVGAQRVANFFNGTRSILGDYLHAMGYAAPSEVGRGDLVPLTEMARHILGEG